MGRTLRQICKEPDTPCESAVRQWVYKDASELAAHYAHARDMGLDSMAEELMEIAADGSRDWEEKLHYAGDDTKAFNAEAFQRSKLIVDTKKWYLSKLAPKRYGDKLEVSGSMSAAAPILNVMVAVDSVSDAPGAVVVSGRAVPVTHEPGEAIETLPGPAKAVVKR